ncbi:hypothetical protein JC221_063 [Yersinia phage JC221]|nr:hypothetical protein JC221_063 [Yersinia phage JC221]
MIFTVERCNDYENSIMLCASDSLLKCIDAVNDFKDFPYVSDRVIFRVWENEKEILVSNINGQRADHWWGVDHTGPVTYEEVMNKMVKNESI